MVAPFPKICSIVLCYGAIKEMYDCIESLVNQKEIEHTIILVQNGAIDSLMNELSAKFENVIIVRNGCNIGAAAGRNLGIKEAKNYSPQYIFFADNDAIIADKSISLLVSTSKELPKAGFLSCLSYSKSNPERIFSGGAYFIPPISTKHINNLVGQKKTIYEVDFASTLALLVPISTIDEIGWMDEKLFVYDEDVDWCLRGKQKGLSTIVNSYALAYHDITPGKLQSPFRIYYGLRNRLAIAKKLGYMDSFWQPNVFWPVIYEIFKPLIGKYHPLGLTCSLARIVAVIHFLRGRYGICPTYLNLPRSDYLEEKLGVWLINTPIWSIAKSVKRFIFHAEKQT